MTFSSYTFYGTTLTIRVKTLTGLFLDVNWGYRFIDPSGFTKSESV